ncbi:MAG: metallophosphoesterase [Barnesiella sp.]|nr:metallophosphoesterase [Barnesiella sp.]
MQLYSEKRSIMNKLIGLLTCLCFSTNLAVAQNKDTSSIIKFGLFADTQYADCPSQNTRYYREALQKLDTCIEYFNRQEVQFTINLGDITDRKNSDLEVIKQHLSQLNHKIYHLTGNHDYKDITNNSVLYKQLDMPSEYYSFKKGDWVFIMLNTNEIASYANIAGTPKENEWNRMQEQIKQIKGKYAYEWNGGISEKQMKWLDRLLKKCEKKGLSVLIFSHHPLYPQSDFSALNGNEIVDTLSKYSCIKAAFSGHHHAGAFGYYKNIPLITLEGMVETENQNAYAIVEISQDHLLVKGQGRASSYSFKLSRQ